MTHHIKGIVRTQTGIVGLRGSLMRIALVLLVVGGTTVGDLSIWGSARGWAQTLDRASLVNLKAGQVTAVRGTEIQIDNKDYPLASEVTITDSEGRPKDLNDLGPGTLVRFHVKNNQIDRIVIMLPS